jgi:hypothetical protein
VKPKVPVRNESTACVRSRVRQPARSLSLSKGVSERGAYRRGREARLGRREGGRDQTSCLATRSVANNEPKCSSDACALCEKNANRGNVRSERVRTAGRGFVWFNQLSERAGEGRASGFLGGKTTSPNPLLSLVIVAIFAAKKSGRPWSEPMSELFAAKINERDLQRMARLHPMHIEVRELRDADLCRVGCVEAIAGCAIVRTARNDPQSRAAYPS